MYRFITTIVLASSVLSAEELLSQGPYFNAAVLYWQAEEIGLAYAIKSDLAFSSSAQVLNPSFQFSPGFNVGVGYRLPHDHWDLSLQFTHFNTHADDTHRAKNGKVFFPVWDIPDPLSYADQTTMHWRLHLGIVDALLSKRIPVVKTLTLQPTLGISYAWIRQKYHLFYLGGSFSAEGGREIRTKNKYWGVGPAFGLKSLWECYSQVFLFAQGSGAILFGDFYLHQDEDTQESKLLGIHNSYRANSPMMEYSLGVQWEKEFDGALKRLSLMLAWDQMVLFSQNQLMLFVDEESPGAFIQNRGDLTLMGIEFSMRFDF
jgi:hypothetical protein